MLRQFSIYFSKYYLIVMVNWISLTFRVGRFVMLNFIVPIQRRNFKSMDVCSDLGGLLCHNRDNVHALRAIKKINLHRAGVSNEVFQVA